MRLMVNQCSCIRVRHMSSNVRCRSDLTLVKGTADYSLAGEE